MRAVGDSCATRIEQDEIGIETMPAAAWTVDTPTVAKYLGQLGDVNVPNIARPIFAIVQLNFREDMIAFNRLQHEMHRCAMPAQQDEVHAIRKRRGAKRRGSPTAGAKVGIALKGCVHGREGTHIDRCARPGGLGILYTTFAKNFSANARITS